MSDLMPPRPGLSPVSNKTVVAKFDSGSLSTNGGVLALRAVEPSSRRDRLAACMVDPRARKLITHSLANILRFRPLAIAAGYEDGNDVHSLGGAPMFKKALDLSPSRSPTVFAVDDLSAGESAQSARRVAHGPRYGRFLLRPLRQHSQTDHVDIDDTFDAVHGAPQLRLFNAQYDEYDFQLIVVCYGGVQEETVVLRSAKRPAGKKINAFLRRLLRVIRAN